MTEHFDGFWYIPAESDISNLATATIEIVLALFLGFIAIAISWKFYQRGKKDQLEYVDKTNQALQKMIQLGEEEKKFRDDKRHVFKTTFSIYVIPFIDIINKIKNHDQVEDQVPALRHLQKKYEELFTEYKSFLTADECDIFTELFEYIELLLKGIQNKKKCEVFGNLVTETIEKLSKFLNG